jgi:hypothetical protein
MVVRFLNGLKDEIRAPIALHRPKDVDTASALALLQEEELEARKRGYPLNKDSAKPNSKGFSAWEKNKSLSKKEDTRKADKTPGDEKIFALFAHRKANGLCFTCGEKWTGRTHKCSEQVPIHILHEIMELLQTDPVVDSDSSDAEEETSEDCVMAVQEDQPTTLRSLKRRTMRFRGYVGKQELLILLDSGSAGTFISEEVARKFQHQLQSCEQLTFSTADGTP